MKTAAIYARYSSDLQKDRSIDDQIELCKGLAARHGYKVTEVFTDRAKSGASMFERDGLLALMNAAKREEFDAVITEGLSRLSRDMEDTAAIFKRLKHRQIKIFDTNGEVTDVHIGVGGIVNSMYLKNLADSVRRGNSGRVKNGLVPGRIAYGYRATGTACEREPDPEQAKVVLRIFNEYAEGQSLRDINAKLVNDGITVPNLLTGGLLKNHIYIGELLWNKTVRSKDPDTGKPLFRDTPEADRIKVEVSHLRIVPQDLWDRVQAVCAQKGKAKGWHGPRQHKYVNKDQLLLGLLTCGACGGTMVIGQSNPDGTPRMVCSVASRKNARTGCTHSRSYSLATLQDIVLSGVKAKLTDRKALLEMTRAYHGRWAERQQEIRLDGATAKQQLNRVTVQIDRLVTAISDSDEPVKALVDKLKALEIERAGLAEKVKLIAADTNVVTMHPAAIDKFGEAMEMVHAALTSDDPVEGLAPFRVAFRNAFERIAVHPTKPYQPYEVTPYARIAAIMGMELFPKMRDAAEMLAEQGVTHVAVLHGSPTRTSQDCNDSEGLISLGLWKQAA